MLCLENILKNIGNTWQSFGDWVFAMLFRGRVTIVYKYVWRIDKYFLVEAKGIKISLSLKQSLPSWHYDLSRFVCKTSWVPLKWKTQRRKLRRRENVAQRHYFKTSLQHLQDVLVNLLIQFMLQLWSLWFLYWATEIEFFFLQQIHQLRINVKTLMIVNFHRHCIKVGVWSKIKVESTYVHWLCFNVGKTSLKQSW